MIVYELFGSQDGSLRPGFSQHNYRHGTPGRLFYYRDFDILNATELRASFTWNITNFDHDFLVPGSEWYYELYVRNQGYMLSTGISYDTDGYDVNRAARAVGC